MATAASPDPSTSWYLLCSPGWGPSESHSGNLLLRCPAVGRGCAHPAVVGGSGLRADLVGLVGWSAWQSFQGYLCVPSDCSAASPGPLTSQHPHCAPGWGPFESQRGCLLPKCPAVCGGGVPVAVGGSSLWVELVGLAVWPNWQSFEGYLCVPSELKVASRCGT